MEGKYYNEYNCQELRANLVELSKAIRHTKYLASIGYEIPGEIENNISAIISEMKICIAAWE